MRQVKGYLHAVAHRLSGFVIGDRTPAVAARSSQRQELRSRLIGAEKSERIEARSRHLSNELPPRFASLSADAIDALLGASADLLRELAVPFET